MYRGFHDRFGASEIPGLCSDDRSGWCLRHDAGLLSHTAEHRPFPLHHRKDNAMSDQPDAGLDHWMGLIRSMDDPALRPRYLLPGPDHLMSIHPKKKE